MEFTNPSGTRKGDDKQMSNGDKYKEQRDKLLKTSIKVEKYLCDVVSEEIENYNMFLGVLSELQKVIMETQTK